MLVPHCRYLLLKPSLYLTYTIYGMHSRLFIDKFLCFPTFFNRKTLETFTVQYFNTNLYINIPSHRPVVTQKQYNYNILIRKIIRFFFCYYNAKFCSVNTFTFHKCQFFANDSNLYYENVPNNCKVMMFYGVLFLSELERQQ